MSSCLDPNFRLGCGPEDLINALRAERRAIEAMAKVIRANGDYKVLYHRWDYHHNLEARRRYFREYRRQRRLNGKRS